MLLNGLELIVEYPTPSGYRCRGFRGLTTVEGLFLAFDGLSLNDQPTAQILGEAFCSEILHWMGVTEESSMPCRGTLNTMGGCHALNVQGCRKLLVTPGGGSLSGLTSPPWPAPSAVARWPTVVPSNNYEVLPTLPAHSSVTSLIPPTWQHLNVGFWTVTPTELLPSIFQRLGIAPHEQRIFISYLRRETTELAEQLFVALIESGFDVFLDRFSVPVGVDFQQRLQQDLSDKGMVLLLNSPALSTSRWVMEEVATVKRYRLGLYELSLPNVSPRPDIAPEFRRSLQPTDLTSTTTLTQTVLGEVIQEVGRIHAEALHRRRYELADNFAAALSLAGATANPRPDGTFFGNARLDSSELVVALVPRPPEVAEFCQLHTRNDIGKGRAGRVDRKGFLISPAPNFLASRQAEVAWLGSVSDISHVDESQLITIAALFK